MKPAKRLFLFICSVSFLSILQLPFFNSSSIWTTSVIEYLGFSMGNKATTLLVELPYSRLHEYTPPRHPNLHAATRRSHPSWVGTRPITWA
jgi:hypothetical protein